MPRRRTWAAGLLLGSAMLLLTLPWMACTPGPGAQRPRPSSPMNARDVVAFDGGADFVADPTGLSGRWFQDWEQLLRHRLDRSDVVAIVEIASVANSADAAEAETVSLVPEAIEVLKGSWPDEITLVSDEGDAGRVSVARSESRLLSGSFVVFIKWASKEGDVVARWHLSPAEGEVRRLAAVRFGGETDTRIVRHVN